MFYLCCIESRPEQFEAFFLDKSSQWIYLDSQGQERARRLINHGPKQTQKNITVGIPWIQDLHWHVAQDHMACNCQLCRDKCRLVEKVLSKLASGLTRRLFCCKYLTNIFQLCNSKNPILLAYNIFGFLQVKNEW